MIKYCFMQAPCVLQEQLLVPAHGQPTGPNLQGGSTVHFLTVQSHKIEYVRLQPASGSMGAPIVMLHEGLGSIAMWGDFPRQAADATGCEVIVYSRSGYGNSDPISGSRRVDYMHGEALDALPDVLDQLQVDKPVLLGHSDGGSIALIHAGAARRPLAGVIVLAPHVLVEPVSVASIAAAREAYLTGDLRKKLARYHADVDAAFWGWNDIWLHPEFLSWNIEEYLPTIRCPVLAVQGEEDQYGTMQQLDIIARNVRDAEVLKLARCGHSPHRDQPRAVLQAVTRFMQQVAGPKNA